MKQSHKEDISKEFINLIEQQFYLCCKNSYTYFDLKDILKLCLIQTKSLTKMLEIISKETI